MRRVISAEMAARKTSKATQHTRTGQSQQCTSMAQVMTASRGRNRAPGAVQVRRSAQTTGSSFNSNIVCYKCKQNGHFMKDCPWKDTKLVNAARPTTFKTTVSVKGITSDRARKSHPTITAQRDPAAKECRAGPQESMQHVRMVNVVEQDSLNTISDTERSVQTDSVVVLTIPPSGTGVLS